MGHFSSKPSVENVSRFSSNFIKGGWSGHPQPLRNRSFEGRMRKRSSGFVKEVPLFAC